MRDRIYISGKISGLTREEYTAHFNAAEKELEWEFKVFNPARWGWLLRHVPYRFALAIDIFMMCFCERIYLLDGWTESAGACAERQFAATTGMIIMYER